MKKTSKTSGAIVDIVVDRSGRPQWEGWYAGIINGKGPYWYVGELATYEGKPGAVCQPTHKTVSYLEIDIDSPPQWISAKDFSVLTKVERDTGPSFDADLNTRTLADLVSKSHLKNLDEFGSKHVPSNTQAEDAGTW